MKNSNFLKNLLFLILTNIILVYSKNLLCPNIPVINIGLKSTPDLKILSVAENKMQSNLTQEERRKYEEKIDLKRAFSAREEKIFNSFKPEVKDYWKGLNYVTFLFFLLALFPITLILVYIILRFCFKKCTGPRKATDITRFTRNCTWVLMGLSTLSVLILFTILLVYSVKTNKDVKATFDRASDLIDNNEELYSKLSEIIQYYSEKGLNIPDSELMTSFKADMDRYVEETRKHTDQIKKDDNSRNIAMILLYVYYLIMIILSFLFFFLKWKTAEGILVFIILFTVPAMIVFEGYNAKFFFFYSDLCGSINGALYHNEFPVCGQALGYYYNCYDRKTRSELYSIRFILYKSAYSSENADQEVKDKYNSFNFDVLSAQFNCQIVTEIVPKIESDFCKDNLDRIYNIFNLMIYLTFCTLIMGIAVRMMENLIWKKKIEIDSMIENLEQIY